MGERLRSGEGYIRFTGLYSEVVSLSRQVPYRTLGLDLGRLTTRDGTTPCVLSKEGQATYLPPEQTSVYSDF